MNRISIHHIGGRDGNGAFPLHPRFQDDLVVTFYDADADCIEQIKERTSYLESEVHVLPYCVGAISGPARLHINYDPYTSSVLPFNQAYGDFRAFTGEFDYVLGESTKPMERRDISVVALDELLSDGRLGSTPPDFLSVDTQGSEYDILTGARQVLRRSVLAAELEVEFHPVYQGQKLFGELLNFMSSQGFLFIGFSQDMDAFAPCQAPVSVRAGGFLLAENALFIRNIETVGMEQDEATRCLQLHKLAFLAVMFGQIAYAAKCLRRADESPAASEVRAVLSEKRRYGRFLAEFRNAVNCQPALYPATFQTRFSFEGSRARFHTANQRRRALWLEKVRDWIVRKPNRWRPLKKIQSRIMALRRRATIALSMSASFQPFWRHPAFRWRTEVERVLRRYGLHEQAKTVRRNRLKQAPFCDIPTTPAMSTDLSPANRSA
jgi:FkbM family methyltransferase